MPDPTPEEVLATMKKQAEDAAAAMADMQAKLEEAERTKDAAEKLMRKTAAELQKVQTQRKAADAGLTDEKLKELRAEARAEVLAEVEPQLQAAEKIKSQNRALLLDGAVKQLAVAAGFLPEKVGDFWKLRGDEFDLTEDGKPMVKGKLGLDPVKHVETLKKLNPEWVKGTQAAGGGAAGSTTGTGAGAGFGEKMTAEQRLSAAHEAGMTE